ncbi:MAG: helix-turn-helix domain-containing protein [Caldilineaceae bacterium]
MNQGPIQHRKLEDTPVVEEECGCSVNPLLPAELCPVEEASRIVGQKWTLQIVYSLMGSDTRRFCELQEALGGVNPSTLSSRLKMLEEEGMVERIQISSIPPHVEYRLTPMGEQLSGVIRELTNWSQYWLCNVDVVERRQLNAEHAHVA